MSSVQSPAYHNLSHVFQRPSKREIELLTHLGGMSSYEKAKTNKLKFKGDTDSKKKRKRSGAERSSTSAAFGESSAGHAAHGDNEQLEEPEPEDDIVISSGAGRITSSGKSSTSI